MRTGYAIFLLACLGTTSCEAAPQSAGVSAKLDWWRQDSFNSASSDYLYTSFRDKVIILSIKVFFYIFSSLIQGVRAPNGQIVR